MESPNQRKYCVVIPAFNEERAISTVVSAACAHPVTVVVVDDGSSDATSTRARDAGAHVITLSPNRGKGGALEAGFAYAREHGFEAVITLDADGQHPPAEIADFIAAYETTGAPAILGNRLHQSTGPEGMPWIRRRTNRFMSRLLSRIMHQNVPDTQNGYRLYRTDLLPLVNVRSGGFAAESEILLRIAEQGHQIHSIPTQTVYGDEESKIHPLRDTILFIRMLRKYMFRKALKFESRTSKEKT